MILLKYLLLAEKPDQARKYAHALGSPKEEKGIFRVTSTLLGAEVLVAPAVGHLVERVNPYPNFENWELANLPVLPDSFQYAPKKETLKAFKAIQKAVKEVDGVIIGTDPDREGEAIAYRILELIPQGLAKVRYRLWANSLTTKGLQEAFGRLRDPVLSVNYFHEAAARSDADWLVGFNLSPFVTLKMKAEGLLGKKEKAMSVGRVQTPIVSLIVRNDEAITHFEPQPYWQLALLAEDGIVFINDTKYQTEQEAQEAFALLESSAQVSEVVTENKSQTAPKLYNLTQLQSEMSQTYQFEATKTKDLVQSLYQKGFLSYPRTDATAITTNEYAYLIKHIEAYQAALNLSFDLPNRKARKPYVNDDKVLEHYAIIPTELVPNLDDLSTDEELIYTTVTKRTLLMFTSDYHYQSTQVLLTNGNQTFKATGTVTQSLGWRSYVSTKTEDKEIPAYQEGQKIVVSPKQVKRLTKPPTRISESILLKKLLPKYNLGTSATRDGMIDLIQRKGYVTKDKKTGQFFPTDRGRQLIHYLDTLEVSYTNPETTGKWEAVLAKIGQGEVSSDAFVQKIKWAITKQIEKGYTHGK